MTPASPVWRKATASGNSGCIEVAFDGPAVLMRETGDPSVVLRVSLPSWEAFTEGIKGNEFDLPSSLGTGSTSWVTYNQEARLS